MQDETTSQSQGTPLVSQEQIDNQAEASELRLLTNAELLAEQGADADEEDTAETEGEDDTAAGDDQAVAHGSADSNLRFATKTEKTEPEAALAPIADPGQFVPSDRSFEVVVYEGERNTPKTVKITSIEAWDELLESEPNLGTSVAVVKAQRAAERMDRGIEQDQKVWEAKKSEYDESVQQTQAQEQTVNQWSSEMDYLIAKKELPPISTQLRNANWGDPKVASQPAVKAQIEILNYMKTENADRVKHGLTPITSVLDAYQGFTRQQEKAHLTRTEVRQARQVAGSRVASSAPRPAVTAPRGVSIGRIGLLG